jgi:ferredoxin
VPDGPSIKEALEAAGMEITTLPSSEGHFMPCQTVGCWACAVNVDGKLQPACGLKSFSEDRTEKGHLLCLPAAAELIDFFLR